MASDGTGTSWDKTLPLDTANVSDLPIEIRDVRAGAELRLAKEHVEFDDVSVGGEHKQGSAVAYQATSTFPTKRPNGTDNLDTSDTGRLFFRKSDGTLWLWSGTAWQAVKITGLTQIADGLITAAKVAGGFASAIIPYARVIDLKSDGTDGGTFTSGSWQTRTLNTTQVDNGSTIITVASNQITLNAGTYRVRASAPAQQVNAHQTRWRDITNSATLALGTTEFSVAGTEVVSRSFVETEFVNIADGTLYELQHQCTTTKTGGFGVHGSFGAGEVYSVVEIWKLI